MKNTVGSAVSFTIFGESHGPAVGGVLDGLAAGIRLDEDALRLQMQKRQGAASLSTGRREPDEVRFISGLYRGYTTGTPLTFIIENRSARPEDYGETQGPARPGHADWAARQKYGGFEDYRGGGHFSGRLTAPLTAAGAVCGQILRQKGVRIATHILRAAGIPDGSFSTGAQLEQQLDALTKSLDFPVLDQQAGSAMQAAIRAAKQQGDSVGGILETAATGLPGGVGEPFFDSVESQLSHLLFSIPAVKGVEFGDGFGFADKKGSEVIDPLQNQQGRITTAENHNGGVNGGIANGMPLVLRSCVKPTPSIFLPQQTVQLAAGEPTVLRLSGRHDPCILHRAAVVQTAACALGLLDLCTQRFGTLWQANG